MLSTAVQVSLYDLLATESEPDRRFREFHRDNPGVYRELVGLAREARKAGRRKVGIKMLFEVVRWHRFIQTTDPEFKLNNNYHSRYARLIMDNEPDLRDIFNLRELRS